MSAGAGTRGGPIPPLTLEEAKRLFEKWRADEYGWVRAKILALASAHGEFHGSMLAGEDLDQRNIIGAAVNALVNGGFLVNTGEHRSSDADASHGRKSYVYKLTPRGHALAARAGEVSFPRTQRPREDTNRMNAEKAKAILTEAKSREIYEDPIPSDDGKLIEEAEGLVSMAEEAWANNMRGPEVEANLRLAASEEIGSNGASAPEAEAAQAVEQEQQTTETEPVAQEDSGPSMDAALAKQEPWEGYATEPVNSIIEGIDIFVEQGEEDLQGLLAHIWAYESTHRDRVKVMRKLEEVAERLASGDSQEKTPEAETPPPTEEAPVAEVQPEPEPEPEPEAQPEPEPEEEPEVDREDAVETEQPPEEPPTAPEQPQGDAGDTEYHSLIEDVEEAIKRERLHTPGPIPPEESPGELPFDMTRLTDRELQAFHSAFTAYAYRTNYLLVIEEAKARRCKEAADEMARELLVLTDKYDSHGKAKTMTVLEAEVESDENVKLWRKRQRRHEAFAHSYRAQRDSYMKNVESLSRMESMRHQEWERSGGAGKRR